MVKEILDFIGKLCVEKTTLGEQVSEKNFYEYDTCLPCTEVYAVDGGSAVIIDGGNWIIAKIKTCVIGYMKEECIKNECSEYYIGAVAGDKKTSIKIFPDVSGIESLRIPFNDIEETPNICRAFLELEKIKELSKKVPNGSIILTDGLIQEEIKTNNAVIVNLCKTSRIKTENGRSLIGCLNELSSKKILNKKWFYFPISDKNKTCVAKFHESSIFSYKLQFSEPIEKEKIKKILGAIAYFSRDPELIGYPYLLLKADKVARLRDNERDSENRRMKMSAKDMGISFIEFDESSTIMHELLDKRAYRWKK